MGVPPRAPSFGTRHDASVGNLLGVGLISCVLLLNACGPSTPESAADEPAGATSELEQFSGEPTPEEMVEEKPEAVTSECKDKPGDIEDGNYKKDLNPPGGMDLTNVTIQTGDGTTVVTYTSTKQAVDKTPPGIQSLYRSINFADGGQLLAKLVGGDWEIAHFTLDGQTNFDIEPGIAGKRMSIQYPVELDEPFKWYATTEYGRTLYTDLCPEGYKFLSHG